MAKKEKIENVVEVVEQPKKEVIEAAPVADPVPDQLSATDIALETVTEKMSVVNPDVTNQKKEPIEELPQSDSGFSPENKPPRKRKPVKGVTDKHGSPFDASIHESTSDGQPIINKKDGFLKLKPGRHKKNNLGGGYSRESSPKAAAPAMSQEETQILTQRRYAANISSAVFIKLGIAVFGDEWQPRKDDQIDEQAELAVYFEKYFEVKEINDIPPGAALALGLIGYGAVRMHLPKTQSRMSQILEGAKIKIWQGWNFFKNYFSRLRNKSNASRPDSRTNGERKNDISPEARA